MSRSGQVMVASFAAMALISGCGEATDDAAQATVATTVPSSSPSSTTSTPRPTVSSPGPLVSSPLTVVAETQEATVPTSPDLEPSLQALVDQAADDLATRLSIDKVDIATVSAKYVTWPDKGLGCPQPGMVYLQVTVDGALIELGVGGTTYSYHGGGSRAPFLCQKT